MLRFISIVSSDFWPGFAALAESLANNSGLCLEEYELVVICDPARAPSSWLASRRERITLFPAADLPSITILSPQSQGRRMEQALQKLGVFALPQEWGTCVYIDSDMICLNPIKELPTMQPLTAACDFLSGFGKALDPSLQKCSDINTGLMVFAPSGTTFAELRSVYSRRHQERVHKGDQDIINLWIQESGQDVHRLGSEWNFSKRLQDVTGLRWVKENTEKIRILHFVGAKPWTPNSEIHTLRECRYGWMEGVWWDYFEKSGFAQYMEDPPDRSTVWIRQWILPLTKPTILCEHLQRAMRFSSKKLGLRAAATHS
jgi:hypothetical protein